MADAKRNREQIIITGASRGVGLATAQRLAEQGARLLLIARHEAPLEEAAATIGGEPLIVAGDVAESETWRRVAALREARWDRIDGIFMNAGHAPFVALDEVEPDLLAVSMRVHVTGTLLALQALRKRLHNPSAVLLTASGMHHRPLSEASVWAATTHASLGLTKALAVELAPLGVRVNAVSHGPVDTPIFDGYGMPPEAVAGLKADLAGRTLVGRLARAEEVAELVVTLLRTPFMTGAEVVCDGGYTLKGVA